MYAVFLIILSFVGLIGVLSLVLATFQSDFKEQQALIHQYERGTRLRALAASFVLATDEDEDQSNGMGIDRFQALMQAFALHSAVQGSSRVLDSRSKVKL